MQNKSRRRKKRSDFPLLMIVSAVILVFFIGVFLVHTYSPSKEKMRLTDYFALAKKDDVAVILNGEYKRAKTKDVSYAKYIDKKIYISINFIKQNIDDGYVYDSTEGILRYVTDKNVISVNKDKDFYFIDKNIQKTPGIILKEIQGEAYIDITWLKNYTDIKFYEKNNPRRVVIDIAGFQNNVSEVIRNAQVRRFGGIKSKILSEVQKGEKVTILDNYGKWSKILTKNGVIGCVQNKALSDVKKEIVRESLKKRVFRHKKFNKKIVLVWDQVGGAAANANISEKLDEMKGVNVVSPTWFYIQDIKGNVGTRSSIDYVNKCHAKGIQVWGLISNFENKNVDAGAALKGTSSRDNLVNQTVAAAIASNLDGINVDFEGVTPDEKDGYLEFIKELSLKCKKNDIYLSVDNYVPTQYTHFYSRKVQADYADYIIVMAYDEHFGGSKKAGSVASFPFVKRGVKETLKEVPKNQMVLGLPFFTRIWAEKGNEVSSKSLGMNDALTNLKSNKAEIKWLSKEQQNYGEYKKGDKVYKCWLEDTKSLGRKINLVKDEKLAGAAFWKKGLESNDVWALVEQIAK